MNNTRPNLNMLVQALKEKTPLSNQENFRSEPMVTNGPNDNTEVNTNIKVYPNVKVNQNKNNKWKVDYTAFIRPELIEVIYEQAQNTTLERFNKVWSVPNLSSIKGMVLVFTESYHHKYGKILVDMILLLQEEYKELQKLDPLLEFFDGEVQLSFQQLVKKTVVDPYMIYLYTEGSPSSFLETDSIVRQSVRSRLEREGFEK